LVRRTIFPLFRFSPSAPPQNSSPLCSIK
jgi:hypothetical protein